MYMWNIAILSRKWSKSEGHIFVNKYFKEDRLNRKSENGDWKFSAIFMYLEMFRMCLSFIVAVLVVFGLNESKNPVLS